MNKTPTEIEENNINTQLRKEILEQGSTPTGFDLVTFKLQWHTKHWTYIDSLVRTMKLNLRLKESYCNRRKRTFLHL